MSDVCEFCGKWEDRCECVPSSKRLLRKIAVLEKQLASKDKEIERMRAVISTCQRWPGGLPSAVWDRLKEYEQSTRPDGGRKE